MSNNLNGSLLLNSKTKKPTTKYYEQDVTVPSTKLYCIGPIKKGDYVVSCPAYGCVIRCQDKDPAIGISKSNKATYQIGVIDVTVL